MRELIVVEQRYLTVLAVLSDGETVAAAGTPTVTCRGPHDRLGQRGHSSSYATTPRAHTSIVPLSATLSGL